MYMCARLLVRMAHTHFPHTNRQSQNVKIITDDLAILDKARWRVARIYFAGSRLCNELAASRM